MTRDEACVLAVGDVVRGRSGTFEGVISEVRFYGLTILWQDGRDSLRLFTEMEDISFVRKWFPGLN